MPALRPGAAPILWEADPSACAQIARKLADAILDGGEQERAAAFHHETDQALYTVAHVALRLLLGAHLEMPAAAVRLERRACPGCGKPHGRPAIAGDEVHFSLSHTRGRVLIAFAGTAVGTDIESLPAPSTVESVTAVLHPRERDEIAGLAHSAARAAAFGRVWVRKEAYFKALGIGLARGMERDYLGTGRHEVAHPTGWEVRDVAVANGFIAATATARSTVVGTLNPMPL
ncbi:4'-phosphopantetheinyl transferase family protein [Streptomyces sp. NPDC056637]|uniref:4'-phosphopantetheinyl transferase family protein n=1 Tax=unclassified Streptomyces TaxID=2593676 RepID=UPI0036A0A4E1